MMVVRWTPALAIGHEQIDAQHRELFRRADLLLQAMGAGDAAGATCLFDFLGEYVVEHFAAEERLMLESGFPGYTVHRAAHERFVRDCQSLRQLHEDSGGSAAVAVKAQTWLAEWLQAHIGNTDQQLGRHLLCKPT
jgi:hemerythrin